MSVWIAVKPCGWGEECVRLYSDTVCLNMVTMLKHVSHANQIQKMSGLYDNSVMAFVEFRTLVMLILYRAERSFAMGF